MFSWDLECDSHLELIPHFLYEKMRKGIQERNPFSNNPGVCVVLFCSITQRIIQGMLSYKTIYSCFP